MVKLKFSWIPVVALPLALMACYWSHYPEVMETHLTLLEQYAAKLEAVARIQSGVPADGWGEFVYPFDRARDFARIAARRYPDRGSLAQFRVVLERYAVLLDEPGLRSGQGDLQEVGRRRLALGRAIASARAELKREG